MLYDYGNSTSRIWTFRATGTSGHPSFVPRIAWEGGPGGLDASRAKITSGDFDGDGIKDIIIWYDYEAPRRACLAWPQLRM